MTFSIPANACLFNLDSPDASDCSNDVDENGGPASAPTVLVDCLSEFRNVTALPAPPLMPELMGDVPTFRKPIVLSLVHSRRGGPQRTASKPRNRVSATSYFSRPSNLPPMPSAA